jgi:hypothetical protein
MLSFKKSVFLLSTVFALHTNAYATKSLDDYGDKFWKTQSGAHLHALYPHIKKPSAAVKTAFKEEVTNFRKDIEAQSATAGVCLFDYNNQDAEIDKLYARVEPLLKKEIKGKDKYTFFYTAYSANIAFYESCLHELMEICSLRDLSGVHPLHYKTAEQNKVKNVKDFFKGYEKGYHDYIDQLNKENGTNLKYLDSKRRIGRPKAPDASPFAREHLKCANISLFGNLRRGHPFESTPYFWITSSNVGQFNTVLAMNLMKEAGFISENDTQQQKDAMVARYKALYDKKMASGGGVLLQIKMKNEYVNQYAFLSEDKGVPVLVERDTGKRALRKGNKPDTSLNPTKKLTTPSCVDAIALLKKDQSKFNVLYGRKMNDWVQARLVVNPKVYSNKKMVKINQVTLNPISRDDLKTFKQEMSVEFKKDLSKPSSTPQMSEGLKRTPLGKIKDFVMTGKTAFLKVQKIAAKAAENFFTEAVDIVVKSTTALASTSQEIASRLAKVVGLSQKTDKSKVKATAPAANAVPAVIPPAHKVIPAAKRIAGLKAAFAAKKVNAVPAVAPPAHKAIPAVKGIAGLKAAFAAKKVNAVPAVVPPAHKATPAAKGLVGLKAAFAAKKVAP